MNLSGVSVYENVNSTENFSKSGVYHTISDLLNLNGDIEIKIFCPLCISSFKYKFSLFEHLRTFHNNFLIQAGNQALRFVECPFCSAKFYGKHLTAKHALHHHSKVVRELYINKNKSGKCVFCDVRLTKQECVKHVEDLHFLEFEEEFRRMFICDSVLEMTISELVNSTINDESLQDSWEDVCMDVGSKSGIKNPINSNVKDFEEASRINCYDFTDLKEQLESIKTTENTPKPILKDFKNILDPTVQKSVRRVLRFDLPGPSEDKENSVLRCNLATFKQINLDEHSLLCHDNKKEIKPFCFYRSISCENLCGEPQHSSTPNFKSEIFMEDEIKSDFDSCVNNAYEFQCGKCRKLFRENLDLVSHVKNTHKKFGLSVWQPFYRCAICNARFYKNYYLRKHHNLHKPY